MREHIRDAIRWHYYDTRRGHDTADPGLNGMDTVILQGLIDSLGEDIECLKEEGEAWADAELHLKYGPPHYGTLTWQQAKESPASSPALSP